jgi:hypothetical protein
MRRLHRSIGNISPLAISTNASKGLENAVIGWHLSMTRVAWRPQHIHITKTLPSLENIKVSTRLPNWPPGPPFSFGYKLSELELLKIHINGTTYIFDETGPCPYEAFLVFDKLTAFISKIHDTEWIILGNDFLAPSRYVHVVSVRCFGTDTLKFHIRGYRTVKRCSGFGTTYITWILLHVWISS